MKIKKTNFFEDVYDVVKLIPLGRVTSYGAIAVYLGQKGSARMVGWALNKCIKTDHNIPAHRVVNRIGMLSGKMNFPSPTYMQDKLKKEGIPIQDDQVKNFTNYFWNPISELNL